MRLWSPEPRGQDTGFPVGMPCLSDPSLKTPIPPNTSENLGVWTMTSRPTCRRKGFSKHTQTDEYKAKPYHDETCIDSCLTCSLNCTSTASWYGLPKVLYLHFRRQPNAPRSLSTATPRHSAGIRPTLHWLGVVPAASTLMGSGQHVGDLTEEVICWAGPLRYGPTSKK